MPQGMMNDEDRKRLDDHFWAIVGEACIRNRCWRGEVLNRCRKSRKAIGISTARREIAWQMKRTAFTFYDNGRCCLYLVTETPTVHPDGIRSISFPLLGRMLGFDHSTLVVSQQKLKRQMRADDDSPLP